MERYFSGTSNLVLPVKNKSYFPPEFQNQTRLTYYASLFNSIEINASFYRMPIARTVIKWSNEVQNNFRFSFKLIQHVTHMQKQQLDMRPITAFMTAISAIHKRGCLLIQLPPKFGPDIMQLTNLLAELQHYDWPIAIEFRHPGWYNTQVFDLLTQFNAAMVLHDMRKSAAPMINTSETHVYIRFHGPEGGYRGSYPDDYLYEYAGYIHDWVSEGKDVYCYFNNTLGAAVQNLQTLDHFVEIL
ncbi:MAG TPA: DUF72 domain-containing protein [Mucilaginibacter sp.]